MRWRLRIRYRLPDPPGPVRRQNVGSLFADIVASTARTPVGFVDGSVDRAVGEQDLLTPPWIAREVAAAIPGAQLEIISGDGASHVVPLERPDEFNRLVMRFSTTPGKAALVRLGAPYDHPNATVTSCAERSES